MDNPNPQKKAKPQPKGNGLRALLFYLGLALIGLYFFYRFSGVGGTKSGETIPISKVAEDIRAERIEKIQVEDNKLTVFYKNEEIKQSQKEPSADISEVLKNFEVDPSSVEIQVISHDVAAFWLNILANFLPLLLMIVFFGILIRQAQTAGSSIFSFGKSRAKLFYKGKQKIRFSDAAGVNEAKQELQEVIEFLKTPEKFRRLGARVPKGVLLVGPPGTGKTLLARAVAGEAGVPFFSIAGSEFMEMLVGVGASRVRDLFETAKKNAPAIIFVDELDAIGRQRGAGLGGGHDEREQTLNQILVEMDGFDPNVNVIVMAATNRPDVLDPALLRPGRFDRRIVLDFPDIKGREAIFKIHMRNKPFTEDVDIERLSRRTVGFSGADIENMINEAAILAARANKKAIDPADLEEAATKVKLGPEKKRFQSERDRKIIAFHEAGHAVVNHLLPTLDPVHRISIVSRGIALGFTLTPPAIDRYNESETRLMEMITSLMGGRAAEELEFQELTVGASSDIEQATNLARKMVCEYGMSKLGPITWGYKEELIFLARDLGTHKNYSEEMAAKIDEEVTRIVGEAFKRAKGVLSKSRDKLRLVAETLIKKETIDGEEFEQLMGFKKERKE